MLLARARLRIARNYEENNMLEEAKNILDKAL